MRERLGSDEMECGQSCQTDRLSKENTDGLKGILAIGVLIHHLYQYSGLFQTSVLHVFLQAFGYLSVAEFLFLSGYGLTVSHEEKGNNYIREFPKKRILPFYIIIIVVTVCYLVKLFLCNEIFDGFLLIKSVTFGGTIVEGGWYLQVQLLLYVFWLLIYRSRMLDSKKLRVFFGVALTYCIVMGILGYPTTWYEGALAFPCGILWANHRQQIDRRFSSTKKWMLYVVLLLISFGGAFVLSGGLPAGLLRIVVKILSALLFVGLATTWVNRVPVKSKILKWIGTISLEMYVMQFVFLLLFNGQRLNPNNPYVYVLCVTISTVVASAGLKHIVDAIYRICGKL